MRYYGGAIRKALRVVAGAISMAILVSGPAWASTSPGEPPTAITIALDEALNSWSQFSATSDLEDVRSSFVNGGPQWRQFVSESAGSGVADPRRFTVHEVRLRGLDARTATVWAEVEVSQPDHVSQTFSWDFDFTLVDGRWLVWTVVAADRPTDSETVVRALPTNTTPTTGQIAPTTAPTERRLEALSDQPKAAGTRIPALSAWVVVVTVIGVAAAGYVAPRLDRRRP
jgi:hypothetical protein